MYTQVVCNILLMFSAWTCVFTFSLFLATLVYKNLLLTATQNNMLKMSEGHHLWTMGSVNLRITELFSIESQLIE